MDWYCCLFVNINERSTCNASQNSTYANYVKSMDVLIWDGIFITNKYAFDTVDRLFKDLCRNSKPFGGKEIIVSVDFRQTLPILCHGGRALFVESSVKSCKISPKFYYLKPFRRI